MKKLIIVLVCILSLSVLFSACNKKGEEKSAIYDISARLSGNVLELTESVYYTNNTGTDLNNVKFHLYPNAYRENAEFYAVPYGYLKNCFYKGASYGGIEIGNVNVDGVSAAYCLEKDDGILSITLADRLKPYGDILIEIAATVTLPYAKARLGITEHSINLGNFYPVLCAYENGFMEEPYYNIGDPFYSDVADYYVTLTAPYEGLMASSGTVSASKTADGFTTYEIDAEKVRDFAAVIVFDAKKITRTVGNTLLNYVYFNDNESELSADTAACALATFNNAFGDYPYPELNVVQTDFIYGGMEYPNLVFINSKLRANGKNYTIVHEIAHQWWYGLVGSNSISTPWQDEGLTEFSTALFYKLNGDIPAYVSLLAGAESRFTTYNSLSGGTLGDMRKSLGEYTSDTLYSVTVYDRGLLMFSNIYETMGEKAFLRAMKDYVENYSYLNASADDLLRCLDKQKKGTSVILNKWIEDEVLMLS